MSIRRCENCGRSFEAGNGFGGENLDRYCSRRCEQEASARKTVGQRLLSVLRGCCKAVWFCVRCIWYVIRFAVCRILWPFVKLFAKGIVRIFRRRPKQAPVAAEAK